MSQSSFSLKLIIFFYSSDALPEKESKDTPQEAEPSLNTPERNSRPAGC